MNEETMHEALGRIVDQGRQELNRIVADVEGAKGRALEAARKADEEMKALVAFAESIPAAIFDRFSNVFAGTVEVFNDYPYGCEAVLELQGVPSNRTYAHKVYGKGFTKGTYRVVVTMEKVG